MPHFRVRVEGKGIAVPIEGSIAVGFFATRAVRAHSPDEAIENVRSMIVAAWTTGKYAGWNNGLAPRIEIEDVWRSSWFRDLLFANDGHAFYPADGCEDEA